MTSMIVVVRALDPAPPVISADEARRRSADLESPYVQEALALDFVASEPDFTRIPTSRLALPDPRQRAEVLAQAIVEVVAGIRPASQLIRHLTPPLYGLVVRRSHRALERRRSVVRAERTDRFPRVRRVVVCEPDDGIAEACAVVVRGPRAHAIAFRMEGFDGRWLVTALTIG